MIRALCRRRFGGDEGIALVTVIAVSAVLAVLVVSATAFTVGTQRKAHVDQSWNASLAAAYAGIEEYQSRLANDPGYFVFGNPVSEFSTATGSTVRLPEDSGGPAAVNPAFGLGEDGPWAEVPGSGGAADFRYELDNSEYYATGVLRLRSTGRSAGETRTIVADLRQTGFIEFLYFTDYEIIDPEITGDTNCDRYRYQGRGESCGTINFISADEINGPMHTNDAFQVLGSPTFNGWTTTSYNPSSGSRRYFTGGAATPSFPAMPGNQPAYMAQLGMPKTNSELKKETELSDTVPRPGCLYTGPTSIKFHANGTMTVKSPWTRFTSPQAGVNNSGCGTPGSAGLARSGGQTIAAPDNNVIYVQNVPAQSSDANGWGPSEPGLPTCVERDRTRSNGANAGGNPLGYPLPGEYVANADVYGCKNGDTFVEGRVNAKVTIAAENYIYVTGDLTYVDANDDILGLVGQNAVYVHNPEEQQASGGWFGGNYSFSGRNRILNNSNYVNRRIDGAILSVAHTFMVQNYNRGGNRQMLTVNGAIAQKYRGPVGTGNNGNISTGYGKNYNYDERFRYVAPPKFLSPVTTTYGVTVWVEVSAVMAADGSYR